MKELRQTRRDARTADGVQFDIMTPAEKTIMITKTVADCHEVLLKSGSCNLTFHTTATWLPLSYLERDKGGACKDQYCALEELEVSLQHFPEYKFTEQCPRSKVLEEADTRKRKEKEEECNER